MPVLTPGRILIALSNIAYGTGAFIADWNHTHIYNPRWPPHAKFHNGQTMSFAILLSVTSTALLYFSAVSRTKEQAQSYLLSAAWIGNLYCLAGLTAILYPGTEWLDPEFATPESMTQKPIFSAIVGAVWVGYALEKWRLG